MRQPQGAGGDRYFGSPDGVGAVVVTTVPPRLLVLR